MISVGYCKVLQTHAHIVTNSMQRHYGCSNNPAKPEPAAMVLSAAVYKCTLALLP